MNSSLYAALLLTVPLVMAPPQLDWMAGHWCNGDERSSNEELWLPARSGLMVGVARIIDQGKAGFDFLRIEIDAEGARYIAQPGGVPPTTFTMTEHAAQRVVFANPQHDFPKRLSYWLDRERLHARVDDGAEGGEGFELEWERCPDF